MRVIALVAAATLFVSASCGGDSGGGDDGSGGGEAQAFCDFMEEGESSGEEIDPTTPEGQERVREMLAAAPSEIRPDLEVMVGLFEELEDLEEDDSGSIGAAFEVLLNPEFLAAAQNLERFGVDECGLEPSESDPFAGEDAAGDGPSGDDDPFADSGGGTEGDLETETIRTWLETEYAELEASIVSIGLFNGTNVSLSGSLDAAQAIAACDAILALGEAEAIDTTVEVYDDAGNMTAEGSTTEGCEAI